jgi:hypothetical protein
VISPAHGLGATGLVTFGLGGVYVPMPADGFVRVRSKRVQSVRVRSRRVRSTRVKG